MHGLTYRTAFFRLLSKELEEVLTVALQQVVSVAQMKTEETKRFEVIRCQNPRVALGQNAAENEFFGSLFELRLDDEESKRRPIIRLDTAELILPRPQARLLCAVLDESVYVIAGELLRDFARRNFGASVTWFLLPMPSGRRE